MALLSTTGPKGLFLTLSLSYLRMKENNNDDCIPPVMSTSVKFLRETGKQMMKSVTVHKQSIRTGI